MSYATLLPPHPPPQATVDERQAVVRGREALSHSPSQDGGGDSGSVGGEPYRMRTLAARAKMSQIARAQASELVLLRKELDRLRQKAFPAFPV